MKDTLEQLIDAVPVACMILERDGTVQSVNPEWVKLGRRTTHFPDPEAGLSNYFDYLISQAGIGNGDAWKLLSGIRSVMEGESEFDLQWPGRDNRAVQSYRITARPLSSGSGEVLIACMEIPAGENGDAIKVDNEADSDRDLHYRLMDQLFMHSPNGIVLVDSDNRITRSNDAFKKLFGYQDSELIGRDVDTLIVPVKSLDRQEEREITGRTLSGYSLQRETLRCHKNGTEIPVLLGTVPVYENGRVEAAYGIYVDLTERTQLENRVNALLSTEKRVRQELEVLLQEVHHRVKNNLAVIVGLMDLQMMDSSDVNLNSRLKEVQGRVYSIARIHEAIYQQEDLLRVHFDDYIRSMAPSWREHGLSGELYLDLDRVNLNLNQAVTAGLLINEVLNIVRREQDADAGTALHLNLRQSGVVVSIGFEASGLDIVNRCLQSDSKAFQLKIIRVLLNQLDGRILPFPGREGEFRIAFNKAEVKGSSSSFI